MAQVMRERDAEVGNDDRKRELRGPRPMLRPKTGKRREPLDERHHAHAERVERFVHETVRNVAGRIGARPVPFGIVGKPGFAAERQRERERTTRSAPTAVRGGHGSAILRR